MQLNFAEDSYSQIIFIFRKEIINMPEKFIILTDWEYHPVYGTDSRLIGQEISIGGDFKMIVNVRREYREHII